MQLGRLGVRTWLDALPATEKAILARVHAHWDAGAGHVCIQPFHPDGGPGPERALREALAPARG